MTPPFLALPREIRNNIYSYLHQDITFKDDYGFNQSLQTTVLVTIHNAPLPYLLEVNWQLHKEYTESSRPSASIATDGLGIIRHFHELNPRLQLILTRHVRHVTLVVDWHYRFEHQWMHLQAQPDTLWRLLQRCVHNLIHPQATTLRIEYIDFVQEWAHGARGKPLREADVPALRERCQGTLFPLPPRKIDGLRLVQCVEGYTALPCRYAGVPYGVRPVRVAFLAYAAPGRRLNADSFWGVDEQRRLYALPIEGLGYLINGKYRDGGHASKELEGGVDRRRGDAVERSAVYVFSCRSEECGKCKEVERRRERSWGDAEKRNHRHEPPYTCCGPRGPLLPDAPRDPEPGWQGTHGWPAANRFHRTE